MKGREKAAVYEPPNGGNREAESGGGLAYANGRLERIRRARWRYRVHRDKYGKLGTQNLERLCQYPYLAYKSFIEERLRNLNSTFIDC